MKQSTMLNRHQMGLSLVELMISLALSGLLIAGVLTLYSDSKDTDRLGNALSRIQESGRFAIEFIARDIRMAGYQGCADVESINLEIIARNAPTANFRLSSLRGFEVTSSNWANGQEFDNQAIESRAKIGSDVIAIQRATTANTQLTGNMDVDNANLQITLNPLGFDQGDLVLVSDCQSADLFRITNSPGTTNVTLAHANSTNIRNRLSNLYNTSAQVMRFQSIAYFVADTGRKDSRGNAIFALFRQTDNLIDASTSTFNIQELVEGVENMQILYGERLTTNNIRYVPANTSGLDMTNVESIRLGMLIASNDSVQTSTDQLTYSLPGEDIQKASSGASVTHPEDQRIRRVFTATINLRNRGND